MARPSADIPEAMVNAAVESIRAVWGYSGERWWVVSKDGCAELATGFLVDRSGRSATVDLAKAAVLRVVEEIRTRARLSSQSAGPSEVLA